MRRLGEEGFATRTCARALHVHGNMLIVFVGSGSVQGRDLSGVYTHVSDATRPFQRWEGGTLLGVLAQGCIEGAREVHVCAWGPIYY